MRHDRSAQPVTLVTTAGRSHSDDITLRQRRYVLTQSVRIVCVVLAAFLPVPVEWKGLLIFGAVVLPWFGVVMANAGPTRDRQRGPALAPPTTPARLQIEPGRVVDMG